MQTGTLAAYPLPYKGQILVTADRTLSTQEMNKLVLVDGTVGPITITLPPANTIRAGGFFQILALRGDLNNVTVRLAPGTGDTYNFAATADIILNGPAQSLLVLGTEDAGRWLVPFTTGAGAGEARGNMSFTGNLGGVITTIAAQNAFVPIGNAQIAHPLYVANPINQLFSVQVVGANETQNQVLRYDGTEPKAVCVRASASCQDPALIGAEGFALQITKNGVPEFPASMEGQTGGLITTAGNVYIESLMVVMPGDLLKLLVANTTSANDLRFSSAELSVGAC